ncbi:ABC transporter substrate-binding protein [Terrarubrum flagellatum]|uniref:ABC transporter substrate-binding protein n=1 Tax=Terrirubrum flagellatum TaxID=2895980 RepID=UPI00314543DD
MNFERTWVRAALVCGAALAASHQAASAQGQVTVYCSILEEQCREGAAIFERKTGIKVSMIRKSTGEVYAQVKAEASNPKGDVWWGGPGESHLQAGGESLLEEYRSPVAGQLRDWAKAFTEKTGYRTSAIYLGALGVAYNTDVLKKRGIPEPKCWADLLDARLKDEVQVADPASSGTAYVFLATTIQRLGEEKGFEFLKALHRNVNQYTKSGIAPLKAVTTGETAVSIGFIHDMYTQMLQGAPIKAVAPCEGTGYETGAVSMIKGAKNPDAAKKFIDFALSPDAQEINTKLRIFSIPSNTTTTVSAEGPDFAQFKLIDYDTARWGTPVERSRLLKRFESGVKSLPK